MTAKTTPKTDPRYPIGTFSFGGNVTVEQRSEWIAAIAVLPAELRAAVEGLSGAHLDTPYREGGWTVRQVTHHVADSHMNALLRFKHALTEENPPIKAYDEAVWALLPDVEATPVEVSLDLVEAMHARWVALLRGMDEGAYQRAYFHPDKNRLVTLDEAVGMYAWHGRHHVAHIASLRARNGW